MRGVSECMHHRSMRRQASPSRADFALFVRARVSSAAAPVDVHHEALAVRLILPPQNTEQGRKVVLIAEAIPPPEW